MRRMLYKTFNFLLTRTKRKSPLYEAANVDTYWTNSPRSLVINIGDCCRETQDLLAASSSLRLFFVTLLVFRSFHWYKEGTNITGKKAFVIDMAERANDTN